MAAIARRQLAAVGEFNHDALDALLVEWLALQIAHADAEHDVLPALELTGQHADRAGRAERRVAAHDIALDEQLLILLRLRGGGKAQNGKRTRHGEPRQSGSEECRGWHRSSPS